MFEIDVGGEKIVIPVNDTLERHDEEETKKTFKVYERYLVKVLSKKGNKIIVDWQEIEDIIKRDDYRAREAIRQYIYSVLLSLNILTQNPRGFYSFSREEEMNPYYGVPGSDFSPWRVGILYFKRKNDIKAYGKSRWSETIYNWNIFRKGELLEKRDVCK